MDCDAKLFDMCGGEAALKVLCGSEAFAGNVTSREGEGNRLCVEGVGMKLEVAGAF